MTRGSLEAVASAPMLVQVACGETRPLNRPAGLRMQWGSRNGSPRNQPDVNGFATHELVAGAREVCEETFAKTDAYVNATFQGNIPTIARTETDRAQDGFPETPVVGQIMTTGNGVFHVHNQIPNACVIMHSRQGRPLRGARQSNRTSGPAVSGDMAL